MTVEDWVEVEVAGGGVRDGPTVMTGAAVPGAG